MTRPLSGITHEDFAVGVNAPEVPQGHVGLKPVAASKRAVCATQHPIVTETVLDVIRRGGNAVDAGIAGCLVQATIEQTMTSHAGSISLLFWDEKAGQIHELESRGTIVPDLPPFRPVTQVKGLWGIAGTPTPFALIPGFMPALKALHERFATRPWDELCAPAVHYAQAGHEVSSFEHYVAAQLVEFYLYTASGRAHFTRNGHLPEVGEHVASPELATTLERLAAEGPDDFITGEWARQFVDRANQLGWPIELKHMKAIPPRWGHGTRYRHRDVEIVQLSPPEVAAIYSALVLGVLDHLDVASFGHYTESAEALYYVGHALRRAGYEIGAINDPHVFDDPSKTLLSPEFHALVADILKRGKTRVELSRHFEVTAGLPAMSAGGHPLRQPGCSCELSIVDAEGNWLQIMNTLQSGGIPGEVVGGVPMLGSMGVTNLNSSLGGWFTGGGRMRSGLANTIVLKNGRPWWSLGAPGQPHLNVVQVLSNGLDYKMEPNLADDAPRMQALTDEYRLPIESRIAPDVIADLANLGVLAEPLPPYYWVLGSFQMSWRGDDGTLYASAGPRMAGSAGGL